ncbi:MAG: DUF2997 domain-containing protein [Bacillota bacterium]
MPKKVEVVVAPDGRIETNFIGFLGDECFDEAEKLKRALQAVGLEIDPAEVVKKGPERIALETGQAEEEEDARKARSGGRGKQPK